MKPFIRSLSAPAEFCLVLFIGFGLGSVFEVWTIAFRQVIVINVRLVLPDLALKILSLILLRAAEAQATGQSPEPAGWKACAT